MTSAEWLQKLVQIPSVNPEYAPAGSDYCGEERIASFLAESLKEFGASEVELRDVEPGRPNLYALFPAAGPAAVNGEWIGVDVHTDTVGISAMTIEPFGGELKDDRIYGRGAVDTKATLAVLLALLSEAAQHRQKPRRNLAVIATMGEENGCVGAAELNSWAREKGIRFRQLIAAEPTMCTPAFAHNGVLRATFEVRGRRAHSSEPHKGKNAVEYAARIVAAFCEEQARLQRGKPEATGHPQLTITKIRGGEEPNSVPEQCELSFDRRIVPGEDPDSVLDQLLKLAADSCGQEVKIVGPLRSLSSLWTDPQSALVRELAEISGREPVTVPFGTNALRYEADLAHEIVVFGPGDVGQAHTADEYVSVQQLLEAERIYRSWLCFG